MAAASWPAAEAPVHRAPPAARRLGAAPGGAQGSGRARIRATGTCGDEPSTPGDRPLAHGRAEQDERASGGGAYPQGLCAMFLAALPGACVGAPFERRRARGAPHRATARSRSSGSPPRLQRNRRERHARLRYGRRGSEGIFAAPPTGMGGQALGPTRALFTSAAWPRRSQGRRHAERSHAAPEALLRPLLGASSQPRAIKWQWPRPGRLKRRCRQSMPRCALPFAIA